MFSLAVSGGQQAPPIGLGAPHSVALVPHNLWPWCPALCGLGALHYVALVPHTLWPCLLETQPTEVPAKTDPFDGVAFFNYEDYTHYLELLSALPHD